MSRYGKYGKISNDLDFYSKQIDRRNKKRIVHYRPRPLGIITEELKSRLHFQKDVWQTGTKLYKLSFQYYGVTDLWWLIGFYNNKPTDADWEIGDEIIIPHPPATILNELGL
jgi:hypothetical protein